ncbi:MAG: GyrI-like domain-containing protein [Planctomycetaceae bacterium]|nr:GyrI-like domain-containing protein [Planctomycetaceae bacterium]
MKKHFWMLACVVIVLNSIAVAAQEPNNFSISFGKLESQTVLYTVYRGPYEKVGQAIGELYAIAGKNRISPQGNLRFVYLNNPHLFSLNSQHCLVEIQIPVSQDSLKMAGTLGTMTDIKTLIAMDTVVIKKPAGCKDYGSVYAYLFAWIAQNGYRPIDNAFEVFESGGQNQSCENIAQSDIVVPVTKVSGAK